MPLERKDEHIVNPRGVRVRSMNRTIRTVALGNYLQGLPAPAWRGSDNFICMQTKMRQIDEGSTYRRLWTVNCCWLLFRPVV